MTSSPKPLTTEEEREVREWAAIPRAHTTVSVLLRFVTGTLATLDAERAARAEAETWIENLHTVVHGGHPKAHKECEPIYLKTPAGRASCASWYAARLVASLAEAEAKVAKLTERRFPIQDGPSIPWRAIAPHERQALRNHDQSLETLARRGGLSPCEAVAVLEDRKWRSMPEDESKARLVELTDPIGAEDATAKRIAEWLRSWRMSAVAAQVRDGIVAAILKGDWRR